MLFESAEHIAEIMNWDNPKETNKQKAQKQLDLFITLNEDEKKLVKILQSDKIIGIDSLALKTNFPVSKVSAILLNLEFAGLLKSLPGKMYRL